MSKTPLERLKSHLRNEWRIKHGVDYAIAYKFDKAYVVTHYLWEDYIREAADVFGIRIATLTRHNNGKHIDL